MIILFALLALAQDPDTTLPSLSDCKPAGEKPWTVAAQTPACRALEVLAQMTYEEKLNFRGALPRLGFIRTGRTRHAGASAAHLGHHGISARARTRRHMGQGVAGRAGERSGEEFAGRGTAFPMINIDRTWHWGRMADTFGEDPFLTAEMVVPEIASIQSQHVVAILKHYLANNQEIDRQTVDEQIPERALNEIICMPGKRLSNGRKSRECFALITV